MSTELVFVGEMCLMCYKSMNEKPCEGQLKQDSIRWSTYESHFCPQGRKKINKSAKTSVGFWSFAATKFSLGLSLLVPCMDHPLVW